MCQLHTGSYNEYTKRSSLKVIYSLACVSPMDTDEQPFKNGELKRFLWGVRLLMGSTHEDELGESEVGATVWWSTRWSQPVVVSVLEPPWSQHTPLTKSWCCRSLCLHKRKYVVSFNQQTDKEKPADHIVERKAKWLTLHAAQSSAQRGSSRR